VESCVAEGTEISGNPEPKLGFFATLRAAWPIPALILALGLLSAGLFTAVSARPKVDPSLPLNEAEALVQAEKFEEAIELLNQKVLGFVDSGKATPAERGRFHMARARAFAGAIVRQGQTHTDNHEVVITDYAAAQKLGQELNPSDTARMIESLVSQDRVQDATRKLADLPAEETARKVRLTRRIVEHALAADKPDRTLILELLSDLAVEPSLEPAAKAWVLARQTEYLNQDGRYEEAITKLLRDMLRLADAPPEAMGELHLRLGEAYLGSGNDAAAAQRLEAAEMQLEPASPLRADAALLLGRILKASAGADPERLQLAADRFATIITDFGSSASYLPALLELAEIDAARGEHSAAAERYSELVEAVRRPTARARRELDPSRVSASLMDWQSGSFLAGDYDTSLRYAELAASLYDDSKLPGQLLLALGQTHRAVADRVLDEAKNLTGPGSIVERLDPATRSELKRHLLAAGEAFRRYADIVSSEDTGKYLESRWRAADSFDLAGDMEQAKREFSLYSDGAPDDDNRRPDARFRLAQVFQVERDFASAAALYRTVMTGVGAASDRARVPLARCLLSDADPSNDAEAEGLLLSTVDGSVVRPDASAFREALFELGSVYYSSARYPEAIARLEEAVERYPDDHRIEIHRYKLADSNRLSAAQISLTLRQGLPQATRDALEQERTSRLQAAAQLYEGVRTALEADPARRLSELERICLRNAYFAIGDCAFDLGDFDSAIAAYDSARLKYADDPSSLVAMVQIVNAYVQQQRWPQARTANERARQHLARFPDEVWQRPDIPMEKKHWERWLDARTLLEQSARVEP